jgi:hypothetical protein
LMAMIMVISVTVVLAGSAADNGTKTKERCILLKTRFLGVLIA